MVWVEQFGERPEFRVRILLAGYCPGLDGFSNLPTPCLMRQREEQDQQRKGEGEKEKSCQTQFQDGIGKREATHKRLLEARFLSRSVRLCN